MYTYCLRSKIRSTSRGSCQYSTKPRLQYKTENFLDYCATISFQRITLFFELTCHKAQQLLPIHETTNIIQIHMTVLLLTKSSLISPGNNVFSICWATLLDTSQGHFYYFGFLLFDTRVPFLTS